MTLTGFLLARIAEDEAEATAIQNPSEPVPYGCWDEDRVVAECEAKRRIVDEHSQIDPCDAHDASFETIPCDTMLALAAVYADHPDYREEWQV